MQRQQPEGENEEKKERISFGLSPDDIAHIKAFSMAPGWLAIKNKLFPRLRTMKMNEILSTSSTERADNIKKGELRMINELENIVAVIEKTT